MSKLPGKLPKPIPTHDKAGRLLPNYNELAEVLKKSLRLTKMDFDDIKFLAHWKKFFDPIPCPFPFDTVNDFIRIVVRCVRIGGTPEKINKTFNLLMMAINLKRFRISAMAPIQELHHFVDLFDPEKLITHYTCFLEKLKHQLSFLDDGGIFKSMFLNNLTSPKVSFMNTHFLAYIYGATLTGFKCKLSENTMEFIRGMENYIVLDSEYKIHVITNKYIREAEILNKRLAIQEAQANPGVNKEKIRKLEEENIDLKKKLERKKKKLVEQKIKYNNDVEVLEIELEEKKKKENELLSEIEASKMLNSDLKQRNTESDDKVKIGLRTIEELRKRIFDLEISAMKASADDVNKPKVPQRKDKDDDSDNETTPSRSQDSETSGLEQRHNAPNDPPSGSTSSDNGSDSSDSGKREEKKKERKERKPKNKKKDKKIRRLKELRELKKREHDLQIEKKINSRNIKILEATENIANEARVLLENSKDEIKEALDHFKETLEIEKENRKETEKQSKKAFTNLELPMRNSLTLHFENRANYLLESQNKNVEKMNKDNVERIKKLEEDVQKNANNNFVKEMSLGKDIEKLRKLENYSLENIKANYERLMKDLISEKDKEFTKLLENKMADIAERGDAFELGRDYQIKNLREDAQKEKPNIRKPIYNKIPEYILLVKESRAEKFFKNSAKIHLKEAFTIKSFLDTVDLMPYDHRMSPEEWELQKTINSYAYARELGRQRKAERQFTGY